MLKNRKNLVSVSSLGEKNEKKKKKSRSSRPEVFLNEKNPEAVIRRCSVKKDS